MDMKKKIISRAAVGLPVGVAIGYGITIVISLFWGGGSYFPCVPELVSRMGSELNAVMFQALLCGLLGMGFGAASVIWEAERWSIAARTGIYFLVVSLLMMPIAYLACWMEHSIAGFFRCFGIFALIFLVIWGIEWAAARRTVRKLNASLSAARQKETP